MLKTNRVQWFEHHQYKRWLSVSLTLECLKTNVVMDRGRERSGCGNGNVLQSSGQDGIMIGNDDLAVLYRRLDRLQSLVAIHGGRMSGFDPGALANVSWSSIVQRFPRVKQDETVQLQLPL